MKKHRSTPANGIYATATLLSVEKTGMSLNKSPQMLFKVNVSIQDQSDYLGECKKYIQPKDLPKIKKGMQIPAYVHPKNKNKFMLLWADVDIDDAF